MQPSIRTVTDTPKMACKIAKLVLKRKKSSASRDAPLRPRTPSGLCLWTRHHGALLYDFQSMLWANNCRELCVTTVTSYNVTKMGKNSPISGGSRVKSFQLQDGCPGPPPGGGGFAHGFPLLYSIHILILLYACACNIKEMYEQQHTCNIDNVHM